MSCYKLNISLIQLGISDVSCFTNYYICAHNWGDSSKNTLMVSEKCFKKWLASLRGTYYFFERNVDPGFERNILWSTILEQWSLSAIYQNLDLPKENQTFEVSFLFIKWSHKTQIYIHMYLCMHVYTCMYLCMKVCMYLYLSIVS